MRDRQGVATIMLLLSLLVLSIIPAIQAADAPTLTRVGALKLYPGENYLTPSVIDHGAGFAYFVTHDYFRTQNVVVKVRLSDFTRVGSLVLDVTDDVLSAVIDSAGGFIYFGTYGTAIVRVRLSDF